jgi:hypothetical protein
MCPQKTRAALRRIVAAHAFIQMQRNRRGFRCVTTKGNNNGGMSIGLSREVATPYRREMIMRARRLEQTALTSFLFAACVMLILAAFAAQARDTVPPPQAPATAMHQGD